MAISGCELMLKFAKELRGVVESFENEAEILADREILREIEESRESYKKGEFVEFRDIKEIRKEDRIMNNTLVIPPKILNKLKKLESATEERVTWKRGNLALLADIGKVMKGVSQ